MKKSTFLRNTLFGLTSAALLTAGAQASIVFINFMTNQGAGANANAMDQAQATALGANTFANVDVQGTGGTQPRTWTNVDGVSGSVRYADWWQDQMKSNLYDGGSRPEQGFTGGVVAINGTHAGTNPNGNASTVTLDLASFINNEVISRGLGQYQIQIFYAGRTAAGRTALTDADNSIIGIDNGSSITSDHAQSNLLVVDTDTLSLWSGLGGVYNFSTTDTDLTINVASVGGTTQSGIAGILIIPEPTSALFALLGGLVFLRRRR